MRVQLGLLFIASVVVLCKSQQEHGEAKNAIETCLKHFNWTPDRLEYVMNNAMTRDFGCWNSCLFTLDGMMINNKISEEKFKQQWEIQVRFKQMEYECLLRANQLDDPCEVTNSFLKCSADASAEIEKQIAAS